MRISDFQRHSAKIRTALPTVVFLDPPKKYQGLLQTFIGGDYCTQSSALRFEKIFHQKWVKMTSIQEMQAKKMPFFQKICPKKANPCPHCLEQALKMHVTFVGYSRNKLGIFLYSIFLEHYLGISPVILQRPFSEYSGNMSWEYSTNIPQTIFTEHSLGKFSGISQGTFTECYGNMPLECSMNTCFFLISMTSISIYRLKLGDFLSIC